MTNLVAALGNEWCAAKQARIACIGPRTAAAAQKAGLKVDITAQERTIPGLVTAIELYLKEVRREGSWLDSLS